MRQLVELHDLLDVFEDLNTDIVALAQKETDPSTMARVSKLVGDGITVLTDVEGLSTPTFPLFVSMIIDREGTLRTAIPGTKEARARTDVILAEVASVAGVDAPDIAYAQGRMVRATGQGTAADVDLDAVVQLRTAWSHDAFQAGQPTRLIALPEIAEQWHVYAENGAEMTPFSMEMDLPDGLSIAAGSAASAGIPYPTPQRGLDPLLDEELAWYERDIPIPAFTLQTSAELKVGSELTVGIVLRYQACNEMLCTPPQTKRWEVTLPVVGAETRRGQLYGWQDW